MNVGARTDRFPAGLRTWVAGEDGYPAEFGDLANAPARIWLRGAFPAAPRIAIVGARAATPYGLEHAERLAHDLGRMGFAIVSGLARGIDAAAHRGADRAGAASVAVLAGGIDRITPRYHQALGLTVLERGAILGEQPPGTAPLRAMFVQRNRLIAALAHATIVVEAARRSGALSTAASARRLGRTVFAVPGDVDRATSVGCNGLLKSGARVCESAADIASVVTPPSTSVSPLRRHVTSQPKTLARLADQADLDEREALTLLLRMEWAGEVRALPGQRWVVT